MTNKLGDMLREMRKPELSKTREDEIVRIANEMSDREEKYKSWLQKTGSGAYLMAPTIFDPDFRTSPLHAFDCHLNTDTEIANASDTVITFEAGYGDTSVFDFYFGDKSKISVDKSQSGVRLDGVVAWESNATGYRRAYFIVYDEGDVALWSPGLFTTPAVNGQFTQTSFAYSANIKANFPTAAYYKFFVVQTSTVGLDVLDLWLSTSIA